MADIRQKQQVIETSEAQIAVHWREEEYYYPSSKFIGQANLTDPDILNRFSEDKYPECFREYADMLNWDQYWHTTLDTSDPPFWKWFVGGKLNASYNCVDRHLAKYKNKAALIFVPEPESETPMSLTYRELYVRVNEFAALLRYFCGLKAGDRVWCEDPLNDAPLVRSIMAKPEDRPTCYDMDGCPRLVKERGILHRTLSASDDDDPPALELAKILVLAGMRHQASWHTSVLFRAIGIVGEADRHDDCPALYLASVGQGQEKMGPLALD